MIFLISLSFTFVSFVVYRQIQRQRRQNAETRRLQNYARHLRRLLVQRTIQHKNVYNALQRAMRKRPLTEAPAGPPPKKFRHTTRYPLNSSHLDFYGDSDPDQSVLLWSPSPESSESSRTRGPVSHPLTNNIILPVVPLKKPRSRQSSSYKPRIPYSDSVPACCSQVSFPEPSPSQRLPSHSAPVTPSPSPLTGSPCSLQIARSASMNLPDSCNCQQRGISEKPPIGRWRPLHNIGPVVSTSGYESDCKDFVEERLVATQRPNAAVWQKLYLDSDSEIVRYFILMAFRRQLKQWARKIGTYVPINFSKQPELYYSLLFDTA